MSLVGKIIKTIMIVLVGAATVLAAVQTAQAQQVLRIGYQKSSTLITVLKAQGTLEQDLAKLGVKLQWAEFIAGSPILEALNVGAIDISADVADTVPLFAQAAGAKIVYFAQEAPSPTAQAVLVPAQSLLHTPSDLKGKRIAVTKGSGAHYLLLMTLAKAGLTFKDITPLYLSPADGRAAFERGSVDAWATWDPFVSAVQQQSGARVLADGDKGVASYQRYYLASASYAAARSDVLAVIVDRLRMTGQWVKANPDQAAKLLSPLWGLNEDIVKQANGRRSYDVRLVNKTNLGEQQAIADRFFKEAILPKPIDATTALIWAG